MLYKASATSSMNVRRASCRRRAQLVRAQEWTAYVEGQNPQPAAPGSIRALFRSPDLHQPRPASPDWAPRSLVTTPGASCPFLLSIILCRMVMLWQIRCIRHATPHRPPPPPPQCQVSLAWREFPEAQKIHSHSRSSSTVPLSLGARNRCYPIGEPIAWIRSNWEGFVILPAFAAPSGPSRAVQSLTQWDGASYRELGAHLPRSSDGHGPLANWASLGQGRWRQRAQNPERTRVR